MEIQARIVLLVIGVIILAGVTIDFLRRRNNREVRNPISNSNDLLRAVFSSDQLERQAPMLRNTSSAERKSTAETSTPLDKDFELTTSRATPEIEEYIELPEDLPCSQNILTLSVMARLAGGFDGEELYNALSKANCHCVNKVFYRYAEDYGGGERLFSIVQAVEPGFFEIDNMQNTKVQGITFIIDPGTLTDREAALEQLIRTAKQIAFMLNGELLDRNRKALTLETIAEYRLQIKAI